MKKIEVVAGIIIDSDEILCMQRPEGKHEYTSLKYEFPGGKIEENESRVEALKRELREEMDMNVEVSEDDYFMTVNHTYPDFEIVMHSYKCKVQNRIFDMKEHVDYRWLTCKELDSLDWADADKPIKDKLIKEDL